MPSKINVGKGARLGVIVTWDGDDSKLKMTACHELRRSLQSALINSSYYTYNHTLGGDDGYLSGHIREVETQSNNHGTNWLEMDITIEFKHYGRGTVYHRRRNQMALDYGRGYEIAAACNSIAADVMSDIEPHLYTYYEKVKGRKENPAIELAAKACAAGNWSQGESYALDALKINPNEAEAHFVMGLVERNRSNWSASNSYFEKAANADPGNGKYRNAILRNSSLRRNEEAFNTQMR